MIVLARPLRSIRATNVKRENGAIGMAKFTYDHIHLRSPDPEKTAAYYERMFGAEIVRSMQQGKPRVRSASGAARSIRATNFLDRSS